MFDREPAQPPERQDGAAKFPARRFETVSEYADDYLSAYARAAAGISRPMLARGALLLEQTIETGGTIYACGNGGSAAIANHLMCDFAKGMQTGTDLRPKVVSFSAHTELLLAIANDIAFSEIFAYQAKSWARPGDLLMTISSSGNSKNITQALQWAKDNGIATLALTGFDGGKAQQIADTAIHVPSHNYGIVEDLHQSVMHLFAQYLRQRRMSLSQIASTPF